MGSIQITLINTRNDQRAKVSMPDDLPIKLIISRLLTDQQLSLANQDESGKLLIWEFYDPERARYLSNDETLKSAKISEGNIIQLIAKVQEPIRIGRETIPVESRADRNIEDSRQVFVLVQASDETIPIMSVDDQDNILMFEREDDAFRGAMNIEAHNYPEKLTVQRMDREEIEQLCAAEGYNCYWIPEDLQPSNDFEQMLLMPPQQYRGDEEHIQTESDQEEEIDYLSELKDLLPDEFERFTEKANLAILLAQEESRRLGHNYVGTEQILLGLIAEGTGVAAQVLRSMGINLKDARIEVEKIVGRGSGFVAVKIPFTPRAQRVLKLSLEEARQLGQDYIGTEHLLLGLIREGEGVATRILYILGVDLHDLWLGVRHYLTGEREIGAKIRCHNLSNRQIYIGNLSYQLTEGDLTDVFSEFGTVERVSIPKDKKTGHSRGFGFVEMATASEAAAAIEALDGVEWMGRDLRVKPADLTRKREIGAKICCYNCGTINSVRGDETALRCRSCGININVAARQNALFFSDVDEELKEAATLQPQPVPPSAKPISTREDNLLDLDLSDIDSDLSELNDLFPYEQEDNLLDLDLSDIDSDLSELNDLFPYEQTELLKKETPALPDPG